MKNVYTFILFFTVINFSFLGVAFAKGAHVTILDSDESVICNMNFTGDKGMDSITNTSSVCGFSYALGFGGDFLDSINGKS